MNAATPDKSRDKKLGSDLARLAIVGMFFLAVGYVLSRPAVRERFFDVTALRAELQQLGPMGYLWFIGVAGLLTGFGVPRLWISVAAGAFFGAALGTLLGHGASLLGATITFLVARWFLRGPVKRRMPAKMRKWYERFNEHGFRYLLYMRLFPLSNATVTNVVGGVSKMHYSDFLGATAIGYLPLTIVFAILGKSAAGQSLWHLLAGLAVLLAVTLGEKVLRKRMAPIEEESEEAN